MPVLPPKRLPPLAGAEVAGVEPKILVDVEAGVDPNKLFPGVLPEVAPNSEGVSPPELAGWPLGWPKLKDMLCWRESIVTSPPCFVGRSVPVAYGLQVLLRRCAGVGNKLVATQVGCDL